MLDNGLKYNTIGFGFFAMEQTIFEILTNKDARAPSVVKASLSKEMDWGMPWGYGRFFNIEST